MKELGVPENLAQNLVSSTAVLNRPKGKEKYAEDIIISVFQVDPISSQATSSRKTSFEDVYSYILTNIYNIIPNKKIVLRKRVRIDNQKAMKKNSHVIFQGP